MKCYNHTDADAVGVCTVCGKMVCKDCALNIDGKIVCKFCAERRAAIAPAPVNGKKKEIIASVLLSFFFPGVGQMYNGQVKKGLVILVGYYSLAFITIILCFFIIGICLLPFLIALQIYNIYDAVVTTEKINRGEYVRDWFD